MMDDSETESSVEDLTTGGLFYSNQTNEETKAAQFIPSDGRSLLDKVKELVASEKELTSVEIESEQVLDQFSQDPIDIPFLEGQFVFEQVEFTSFTIPKPFISDQDIIENGYLNDVRRYFDAACEESPDHFYRSLLLTDVLRDLDAMHRLPSSLYKLLFDVAVFSSDDTVSIRATTLLLDLLAAHSEDGNIELFLPFSDVYMNVWKRMGYSSDHGIDLSSFVNANPSIVDYINIDGSIRSELIAKFPLVNFRNYLQILLVTLSLEGYSSFFSESQTLDLLERCLLLLVEPRTMPLYDLICSCLGAVVTSCCNHGWKMKDVLSKVCSSQMIPNASTLGVFLLRIPLLHPPLEMLRCVASYYVLNRLAP